MKGWDCEQLCVARAVSVSEGRLEGSAELATLGVGFAVGLEKRFDAVGIEGPVVVVMVVVHPQLVGAIGIVLCVGCVNRRGVALFRFGQLGGVLIFHAWIECGGRTTVLLRARNEAGVRALQRSKRDVACCVADISSVRLALRDGSIESASVGAFGYILFRLARAVTMPMLTAAVTACAVLRRPLFLESVGFVVALGIDTFMFELHIRRFVVAVPFG
eukprot:6212302-Pleurochrysis_carterae.AAC.3